jgi:hypothetical protein
VGKGARRTFYTISASQTARAFAHPTKVIRFHRDLL